MGRKQNKGFTLAELLIVVAIIAVLVAISIPIFTSQLEKAREATDAANIRAAYAELTTEAMTSGSVEAKTEGNITINGADANAIKYTATVKLTQKKDGWQDTSITNIGGMDKGEPKAGDTATITVNADGSNPALTYAK